MRCAPIRTSSPGWAWILFPPDIFNSVVWLYFALIPAAPLILESQGFYNRPALCPRRDDPLAALQGLSASPPSAWCWSCMPCNFISPRAVMAFFGVISFTLVYVKEELVRWALRSKFGQAQYQRRFILVGTHAEIARLRRELKERMDESVAVVGELSLGETPVQQLVAHAPRAFRQRRDRERRAHLFRAGRNRHQSLRTRRRRGLAGRRFFRDADFARAASTNCSAIRCWSSAPRRKPPGRASSSSSWIFSARCSCWLPLSLAVRHLAVADQTHLARPGLLPAAALRPQRRALHALQIPHHGDQRRAVQTRAGGHERNERPGLQGHQ